MRNLLITKKSVFSKTAIMLFFSLLTSAMAWADQTPVSYIDANGQTQFVTEYTEVTNSMTVNESGNISWSKGTYVVNGNVNFNHKIMLNGDVNLILTDGCKMTVAPTGDSGSCDNHAIESDRCSLHIFGQNEGTGELDLHAQPSCYAILIGDATLGIHGGIVKSTRDNTGLGISVVRHAEGDAIVIDGGKVLDDSGIDCVGNFKIIGGQVDVLYMGIFISKVEDANGTWYPATLTLGCNKATDFINISRIYNYQGNEIYAEVKIADGQVLSDGTNIYKGTLTDEEVNAIGLQPWFGAQPLYAVTGLALTKDGSNVTATFDGTSLNTLSIPVDVNVNSIALNRTFSENKCATIMLPFGKDVSQIEGGKFYTFGGVEATMNEVVGSIEANTPYLVMPSATSLTFTGGATLNTTGGGNQQTAKTDSHWTFKGTYAYKQWIADGANADEIGSVYGFAGVQKSDVEVGDFVCVASGAKIRPMGCYLLWNDEANTASARRMAPASEEMPQRIAVRLVSANGVTTAIGELDTKTGEFSFNDWFSLDGSKLSGKPTEKGVYINNGKKVVIK